MFPQFRATGVYLLILPFVMKETRSSIILIKMAKKLRKTTGDHRYRAKVEDELPSLANLILIATTRPVRKLILQSFSLMLRLKYFPGLMCTELVVASFSVSGFFFDRLSFNFILTVNSQIWLGFAWGVMYCMLEWVTIPRLYFSFLKFFPRQIDSRCFPTTPQL